MITANRPLRVLGNLDEKIQFGSSQIDVSFSCICPVIDQSFRRNIVKAAVDPQDDSSLLSSKMKKIIFLF